MQFDYYAASIPSSLSHCKNNIISFFPGELAAEKPVKPFTHGLRHLDRGFRLYHGGCNPLPFFVASGADAVAGAEFVRSVYPAHRVSRADVAYDFAEPGGFDRVIRLLDPIARAAGVAVTFMGDPAPGQRTGRTMYYGSPKSDVRLCIYEKGLHERSRGSQSASEHWCRVELRVRPRKERKSLTADLKAAEMWGLARWTAKAAEQLIGSAPEYVPDPSIRQSAADKAVAHMLRQYARALRAYVDQHGRETLDKGITAALDDA